VLHTQPDEVCVQPRFVGNIRLLGGRGLTFDLCLLARQLPQGHRLAEQCPGVQFVLDHCGVPDVKGRAFDPWRGDIERMAALPNVVCKISGLVAYADPATWTPGELKPWVDHVIRVFGWDRVVWGGDWPVCTLSAPLAGWVGAVREIVRDATDGQRAGFFRLNAERIYHV